MSELIAPTQTVLLDLVAVFFLLSGGAKILALSSFREGLVYIPYMPIWGTYLVGWTLPVLEIVLALGLFLNWAMAKVAAIALLVLFCGVVVVVLRQRLKVSCNCFGGLDNRSMSVRNIVDNVLLALIVMISLPMHERVDIVETLPVAVFLLFLGLSARELFQQRRGLAGLRQQGIL